MYGWTGKILRVNLSAGETSTIDTEQYVPDFVGGVGIAARIAWEELGPGIGAFDPENMLFVMVGPLTGTLASGGGRIEIAGIAPQQYPPIFSRSSMGGHWGAELKYAGYDGIVVQGQADTPVYLWISNDQVEIRDAGHLWGRGTFATTSALRAEHGPKTRVISCGQAGENLSRIAIIQTETGNAAGQGGYGGVMGSKNLKAIAVRGTQGVQVAHPKRLFDLCMGASREGQSPGRNRMRDWITRRAQQSGFQFRLRKCGFCATPCAYIKAENVQAADGTSAATVALQCGGYNGVTREVSTIARSTTSDLGLNAWEVAYGIIPWLQMCVQRGLIERVDELEIPVPDKPVAYLRDIQPYSGEFIQGLLHKLAYRDSELADVLSEGACYAAQRLFGGQGAALLDRIFPRRCGQTEHWAGHWGPGGSVYWPHWLPPVLQWCIDTRDPASDSTHQWTEHAMRYLEDNRSPNPGPVSPEAARHVAARVYGNPDVFDSNLTYERPEVKAIPAIWHSHRGMLVGSLVLCDREHSRVFSAEAEDGVADTALMSKLFSACTGYNVSEGELDRAGERIWNQLRAIDVRNHGRDRVVDESTLDGFMYPGKDDGVMLDRGAFQPLLDSYYELSGWNPANGWPTREKLEELGLADVADGLETARKLG